MSLVFRFEGTQERLVVKLPVNVRANILKISVPEGRSPVS
jgi:hypothetical protein